MTQVQVNPRQQRVILLGTTSSQSVIAEMVGGKANALVYTAYGEQSAQQQVVTQLGFNGQLREAKIGWYLLGNGYRAYNPTLMRFHSPDSWSPFGRGGLNPYMYCVGNPVNRSDPTGHAPYLAVLRKVFSGADKFLFGGADITGPSRSRALKASAPLGPMSPENTGEGNAFRTIGTIVAGAPGARSHPHSRPLVESGSTTSKVYAGNNRGAPGNGLKPLSSGSTRQGRSDTSGSYPERRTLYSGPSAPSPLKEQNHLQGGEVLPPKDYWPSNETFSSNGSSWTNAGSSISSSRFSRASDLRDMEESWRRLNEMERDLGWSPASSYHSAVSSIRNP